MPTNNIKNMEHSTMSSNKSPYLSFWNILKVNFSDYETT